MSRRQRRLGLLVAGAILFAGEVALRSFDLLTPLVSETLPATLFAAVNSQLVDVARALRSAPPDGPRVALLGNSQMDLGLRPLPELRAALDRAGGAPSTSLLPLLVYASTVTDAEIIGRSFESLEPDLVLLGVSAPDIGTKAAQARITPVARVLDTGFRDGPVPPADVEARLDRWARTLSRSYQQRSLFAELLAPSSGRRIPRAFLDQANSQADFFAALRGTEQAPGIAALRPGFERGDDWDAAARYLDALQGPAYVSGLRERWRDLDPQPEQLAALRTLATSVSRSGGQLAVVLVPENPLLELDPEIGTQVRERSERAAAAVREAAAAAGVPVIDLRRGFAAAAFLDLNHLFFQHGGLAPRLADELARRNLLPVRS